MYKLVRDLFVSFFGIKKNLLEERKQTSSTLRRMKFIKIIVINMWVNKIIYKQKYKLEIIVNLRHRDIKK